MTRRAVLLVPEGVDDVRHPSGGNAYDRRLVEGLHPGWSVTAVPVAGGDLEHVLTSSVVAAADVVLVDGLVLRPSPALAGLPVVALVHLPRGVEDASVRAAERTALASCRAVVTSSPWTGRWLAGHYDLVSEAVVPGVDPAPVARGGGGWLSVGAVTPTKGHDVLVAALGSSHARGVALPPVTVAGALDLAPEHVRAVRAASPPEVRFTGPLWGADLAAAYDAADLLVLPSRTETWGMVLGEALARGIAVVASDVGGVRDAVGRAPDGAVPAVLVRPDDPAALAAALEAWCDDPALRSRLRRAAAGRRTTLAGWPATVAALDALLNRIAGQGV